MTISEFCRALEEATSADPNTLKEGDVLADLPSWDSMSIVAVLAMADQQGVTLSGNDIRRCKTVGDIRLLFGDKVGDN